MKSVNEGAVTTIKQIDGQFTCFVDSPKKNYLCNENRGEWGLMFWGTNWVLGRVSCLLKVVSFVINLDFIGCVQSTLHATNAHWRIQSAHLDGICLPNNFHYRKWQTFKIFRLMVRMFRNRQYTLITNKLWPWVEQYRGIWTAAEILMYFVKKKQNKTKIVMFWIIDNIYDHMVRNQILPLVCVPKIPVKPAATLTFLVALYCEGKCGMKGKAHRL